MDKTCKKQKNKETRALLWRFLKGSKLFFCISMLSAALAALADMISPQIIRAAIDNAIGGKASRFPAWVMRGVDALGGFAYLGQNLWIMALAVVAVAAVKVTSQYIFRVSNTKASETLVKTMRDTAFSHIEHLPFSWHMKNRTGDIIQRCTSDIDTMKNFVSEQLTNVFRILVMLILSLVFMFSMDVPLTLIAFVPMPFIIAYSLHFHTKFRQGFLDCDENEGKLSTMAQENLTGVRVVRAFGRERFEKDKFEAQKLTAAPSQIVACPSIEESPVNLECRVRDIIELGSHDMFLAEIVSVSADEKLIDEKGAIHLDRAGLIAYSHGHYFPLKKAEIGRFGYSVMKPKTRKRYEAQKRAEYRQAKRAAASRKGRRDK